MTALSPILIPAILGYLTLIILLRSVSLRHQGLFFAAASLPTGLGICSLVLFFSLWLMPIHARPLSFFTSIGIILVLACSLILRYFKKFEPFPRIPRTADFKSLIPKLLENLPKKREPILKLAFQLTSFLVFLAVLWTIVQFFTLSVSTNITGGWDARYMWALKAKFMFRSPADWQNMFSPVISSTHPDYPLLWPGTLAWGWNCLGQESLLWPPWASLCFYLSCALLLVWYLAAHVSPITGWLAGAFFFLLIPPLFWSIHQYADIPLAFFMTASGLTLITALRSGETRLFIISGLMAGFAAWTKNEGLLFLLWAGLLLGTLKIFRLRQSFVTISSIRAFLEGALLPIMGVLAFKIFFGRAGDYFGTERSAQDYLALILTEWRYFPMILQSFWEHLTSFPAWKGLWLFFFFAGIVLFFKKEKNGWEGFLFALILFVNLGYILAFLTTPNDLKWHLQTALERLLIHTAPLALAFSFEILTFQRGILENKNGPNAL